MTDVAMDGEAEAVIDRNDAVNNSVGSTTEECLVDKW